MKSSEKVCSVFSWYIVPKVPKDCKFPISLHNSSCNPFLVGFLYTYVSACCAQGWSARCAPARWPRPLTSLGGSATWTRTARWRAAVPPATPAAAAANARRATWAIRPGPAATASLVSPSILYCSSGCRHLHILSTGPVYLSAGYS
jgi:hypothetical protein